MAATGTVGVEVDGRDALVGVGRVALATQGLLYGVVGMLAVRVAQGDRDAKPSQRGAIQEVARHPFGRGLLVVVAIGLAAHVAWRLALAVRGDGDGDEDGGSMAKRVGNLGRAAVYASFTVLAVRLVLHAGGGGGNGGGGQEKESTDTVLHWPGGPALVVVAGLAVIGAGAWNASKGVRRTFVDNLDLAGRSERARQGVVVVGVAGYLARGVVFALVGWFLLQAGLDEDAAKTQGLDGALRTLARSDHGPLLLSVLAVGLVLFGAFRVVDGWLRRPSEITDA